MTRDEIRLLLKACGILVMYLIAFAVIAFVLFLPAIVGGDPFYGS